MSSKVSNDDVKPGPLGPIPEEEEDNKPTPTPTPTPAPEPKPTPPAPKPEPKEEKEEATKSGGGINTIHTIVDVLGKDDNENRLRNIADTDITDKYSYDGFPIQAVIYLGDPPKKIDYIRVASENEQPYTIDFANSNDLKGFEGSTSKKGTLKRGLNDIKVKSTARYVRFEFTGNKALDEDKNKKPDPLGIYYIQIGQGEIDTTRPMPVPAPLPTPEPEGPTEPPKPTEGRIKDWGGDIKKGAERWKAVVMNKNSKLYKVVDAKGVNIADTFSTQKTAQDFITWHQWSQGVKPAPEEPTPEPGPTPKPEPKPEPEPNPKPEPTPSGTGVDKNGVKLLLSKGDDINYTVKNNFRDDGKRFDFNVGDWSQSEATGYFRFTKDPVDDEISIKWSTLQHSGKNEVKCYDSGVSIKNGKSRLRWENPHPNYTSALATGQGSPLPAGKWIGYKGTKTVGKDGSVTIKLYQDTGDNETKPSNTWKEIFTHTDTKYKETGKQPYVTLRVDDPSKQGQKNLEARWLSVAKI